MKEVILPKLLKELRLPTMSRLWEEESKKAIEKRWPPMRYLTTLCEYELSYRDNRKLKRRIAEAKLPKGKTLETLDFSIVPTLNKSQINAFSPGGIWIENDGNLLIFESSGAGKRGITESCV